MWQSRVRPVRVSERAIPMCLAGRSLARAAAAPSAPPAPPATTQYVATVLNCHLTRNYYYTSTRFGDHTVSRAHWPVLPTMVTE